MNRQQIQEEAKDKRLYEMKSFCDPDLERCRQNALNAKKNRDKKKQEKERMESDLKSYKKENLRLTKDNQAIKTRCNSAEQELQRLRTLLQQHNLEDLVKAAAPCTKKHPNGRAKAACKSCSLGQ